MENNITKKTICNNLLLAFIWRLLIVIAGAYALIVMFINSQSSQILCYFTMQSNIFAWLLFVVLTIWTFKQLINKSPDSPFALPGFIQLGLIYFIQITFIVYATMLSGSGFTMNSQMGISNVLLHYIVPIMALIDWLIFFPHGKVNYKHALIWLGYPFLYVIFAFIRAGIGQPFIQGERISRFPYFFMDWDVLRYNIIWIFIVFFVSYYALGCLLVFIDKLIYKKLNK